MIGRVTNQTMMRQAGLNLQANISRLAKLQEQASSQKAITKPSDDPDGTAAAMRIRGEQKANAQYGANIENGDGWLSTIDTALSSSIKLVRKVRDLMLQAADPVVGPSGRQSMAAELDSLKDDLLGLANTTFLGRNVFAGTSDAGVAFQPDYTYTGTGAPVERRVAVDRTVRVDADGAAVYGTGSNSVFALIEGIANDLRGGVDVAGKLTDVEGWMNTMIAEQATSGARQMSIRRAQDANLVASDSLKASLSQVEDIDLGQIILDLKTQQVAYQAALSVTSRVLQPTLMDFLR